ncbi:MAG: nitrite reductase small subunit NirD, partial [Mycobacteriaceae bacterium]
MTVTVHTQYTNTTTAVCLLDDLEENLGAAVLLPDGTQIALFRVETAAGPAVHAVSNIDPYMGAAVISRGIVGEHEGEPTVASPLLKQRFRLSDGASLEDPSHTLPTYA